MSDQKKTVERVVGLIAADPSDRRPWLMRKQNESVQEWNRPTNHSCYACGDYYKDLDELDVHESEHR